MLAGHTYAASMQCEMGSCPEPTTHEVRIWFPDEPEETWQVCRAHDRELKRAFVARRQPKSPDPAPAQQEPTVHCKQCDQLLGEPTVLAGDSRQPCSGCGSTERLVRLTAIDTITAHAGARVRSKRPGCGGWLMEVKGGDDYTRDLDAWGERTLEKDREHDRYRELIKLHDGSRLESTARLSDHHG
jgi:hypothetical protein